MNRLLAIARKELWQLRRDRLTLVMAVMIPVLQLLLFGFAIDTDVRHMPMIVYDQDRSPTSRAIATHSWNAMRSRILAERASRATAGDSGCWYSAGHARQPPPNRSANAQNIANSCSPLCSRRNASKRSSVRARADFQIVSRARDFSLKISSRLIRRSRLRR